MFVKTKDPFPTWPHLCIGFMSLWSDFVAESSDRLRKAYTAANPSGRRLEMILWTSTMTLPAHLSSLAPDDYIIQIWTDSTVSIKSQFAP